MIEIKHRKKINLLKSTITCKLEGQALHAIKLGLLHPINGKEMIFEAELPLDFQKLLSVIKVK